MDKNSDPKNWFQTLPGVLTGVAAVIGAVTALVVALYGGKGSLSEGLKTESPASATTQKNVETCAARPGYPLGRWGVATQSATPASYSTFVTFTGSSSGTWLPSTGKGSFETSVTPAPGKAVVVTFRAEPGTYKSENQLVVSADGCSMTGTFLDSEGHRGEAIYGWQGDK